jgi:predicted DNA binding CopG/RHH family protein
MPRTHQINLKLSDQEQAALNGLSAAHALSEQELLRRALVALSRAPPYLQAAFVGEDLKVSGPKLPNLPAGAPSPSEGGRSERLNLRLSKAELGAIDQSAKGYGLKPTPYAIKVLRTVCLREPNLLPSELAALAESNRQVHAIGVNINQIARRLNETNELTPGTGHVMKQAASDIKKLRDNIAAVLRSSIERWA